MRGLVNRPSPPDFPKDAFVGTAQYYAQYRLPYPQSLLEDLRSRAGITGKGRLLDLGCGPGRVALALAPSFREVWAVDPEQEMIDVGREKAGECGATNLRWIVGRAEDVQAPSDFFELISIGEAFHRLDQQIVARRALEWLHPGRSLAILWYENLWRGHQQWKSVVREIVFKWTGRRTGTRTRARSEPVKQQSPTFEEVLLMAGFEEVESHEFRVPHVWTLDSLVGYLHSTSGVSKPVLGDKAEAFERDLRETLLAHNSCGQYEETATFGYLLGNRPTS